MQPDSEVDLLNRRLFDEDFLRRLREEYLADGSFQEDEAALQKAEQYFRKTLPPGQHAKFVYAWELYTQYQLLAVRDSFWGGIFSAFQSFFVPDGTMPCSHFDLVSMGMYNGRKTPNFLEHTALRKEADQIIEGLALEGDNMCARHIEAVTDGWDQRIHSESVTAFAIGCHTALDVMSGISAEVSTHKETFTKRIDKAFDFSAK